VSSLPPESPIARLNRETGFGWTYAQLARATGIDARALKRLASRESLNPDAATVQKLAWVFGVPVEELMDPAWFRPEDVLSPHGVALAAEQALKPRETLRDDGPERFRHAFARLAGRIRRERDQLGLGDPGRGRSRSDS
jgi:transcriptional regulator with XRE-family HTH domain